MGRIKELLIFMRNGLAFSFSWLVICSMAFAAISGAENLSIAFLIKLLMLCMWGVLTFAVCFRYSPVRKKGFIFSLTLFYILFIPVEVTAFYLMGVFSGSGNMLSWIIFGVLIIAAYLISVIIDLLFARRKTKLYTEKMADYIAHR